MFPHLILTIPLQVKLYFIRTRTFKKENNFTIPLLRLLISQIIYDIFSVRSIYSLLLVSLCYYDYYKNISRFGNICYFYLLPVWPQNISFLSISHKYKNVVFISQIYEIPAQLENYQTYESLSGLKILNWF